MNDYQNQFEAWASYVRTHRTDVPLQETYLYDTFARELYYYLQNTKLKQPDVFLQQTGKEYPVMLAELERHSGGDGSKFLTAEYLKQTYDLASAYRRLRRVPL